MPYIDFLRAGLSLRSDEKQRLKKGGFFQSMDILNVALFIVTDKLHKTWKINPLIKSKRYELNQMFVMKFEGESL